MQVLCKHDLEKVSGGVIDWGWVLGASSTGALIFGSATGIILTGQSGNWPMTEAVEAGITGATIIGAIVFGGVAACALYAIE